MPFPNGVHPSAQPTLSHRPVSSLRSKVPLLARYGLAFGLWIALLGAGLSPSGVGALSPLPRPAAAAPTLGSGPVFALSPASLQVSGEQSSVSATGPQRADGVEASTVTVVLRDADGMPVEGVEVRLVVSGESTEVIGPEVPTGPDGVATALLRSNIPGPRTVVALAVEPGETTQIMQTASTIFTGSVIGGTVFLDADRDGTLDANEPGAPGIRVGLLGVGATGTDIDGHYLFEGLGPGEYVVAFEAPIGFGPERRYPSVAVGEYEASLNNDLGIWEAVSVGGTVWEDADQDATIDAYEPGLEGVSVSATEPGTGVILAEGLTADDGEYRLDVPANPPDAPANFAFHSPGCPLEGLLSSRLVNPGFGRPIPPPDLSQSPANSHFTQGRYALDPSTYPSNYDFADDDLAATGWTGTGIIGVSTASPHDGNYAFANNGGSALISPAFTVPPEAQSVRWWWRTNEWYGQSVVYVVNEDTGQASLLHRGYTAWGENNVFDAPWQEVVQNLTPYRGQRIRLRFVNEGSRAEKALHIDDVRLTVEIPDWDVTQAGDVFGVSEVSPHDGGYGYVQGGGTSLTSAAFVVPAEVQSVRWWWRTNELYGQTEVYVVNADTGEATLLHRGYTAWGKTNVFEAPWQEVVQNLTPFRGQLVQLRFVNEGNRQEKALHIDGIRLAVEVPDWDVSGAGDAFGVSEVSPHVGGVYGYVQGGGTSLTSASFVVPADAQSVRWWWRTNEWYGQSEVYVVNADTGEANLLHRGYTAWGKSDVFDAPWQEVIQNVTAYRGQRIRLRFVNEGSRAEKALHVDEIRLAIEIPDWDVSGAGDVFGVYGGFSPHGLGYGYVQGGGTSLTSAAFAVPAEAQSVRWWWRTNEWYGQTAVYVVDSDSGEATLLHRGYTAYGESNVLDAPWQEVVKDFTLYRGRRVSLRFVNEGSRAEKAIHVVGLYVTPAPTLSFTVTETNPPGYASSTPDQFSVEGFGSSEFLFNFGDYTVDLGSSRLEVAPTTVVADGVQVAQATAILLDAFSVPMPGREVEVRSTGTAVVVDQPSKTTDANGQVTATLRTTVAQTVTVTAIDLLSGGTLKDTHQVTFIGGPTDPVRSTIVVDPMTVTADDQTTATVIVTLRDAFDNPVSNHRVEVLAEGQGVTIALPEDITNAQGQVTGTVRSGTPQLATLRARDATADLLLDASATVTFVATDPMRSTISVDPATVRAGEASILSVVLRDSAGAPVPDREVYLWVAAGEAVSADGKPVGSKPVAVGSTGEDGTLAASVTSTVVGSHSLAAAAEGITLSNKAVLEVVAAATDPSTSTIGVQPSTVVADGIAAATITISLRDGYGNAVRQHEVGLQVTGVAAEILLPDPPRTDDSGTLVASIRSSEVGVATLSAKDLTDDVTLAGTVNVTFVQGPPDPSVSTVEVSPTELTVGEQATVIVVVRDSLARPLRDHWIRLSATGSNNTIVPGAAPTSADGRATFTLTSKRAETKVITARDETDGVTLSAKPAVTFLASSLHLPTTLVAVAPGQVPADGVTTATITVTARDAFGNPVAGVNVQIVSTGSAVVTQPTGPTDTQGIARGSIVDSTAETVFVSPMLNGQLTAAKTSVAFRAADLAARLSAPARTAPGLAMTYEVGVSSAGLFEANNASLRLDLPGDVTLIGQNAPVEPVIEDTSLTWSLGTLAPGTRIAFSVSVRVKESAPVGSTLEATLAASTTSEDDTPSNNAATASTTIDTPYSLSMTLSPASARVSMGSARRYTVRLANTGLLADRYALSVVGLDPSWVFLTESEVGLSPGAWIDVGVEVRSSGCGEEATIPFTVVARSQQSDQEVTRAAELIISAAPEIILEAPSQNALNGARSVLFLWRTAPDTSGVLTLYPAGKPEEAQQLSSPQGSLHRLEVDGLTRNTRYEWKVEATSTCGSAVSPVRSFTVGNGIVFTSRSIQASVDRDYDQRVQVAVVNQDSLPHSLRLEIEEPYEDLIVNFIGSGSVDETVTLQPGETRSATLVIHAQDASQRDYDLTARLTSDVEGETPITDSATIHIKVLEAGDFVVEQVSTDPVSGARTYRVANLGRPITDLSVSAVDPISRTPARVYLNPNIAHARLGTDDSLSFRVVPLFGPEDLEGITGQPSEAPQKLASPVSAGGIPYDLLASAAGRTQSLAGEVSCPAGTKLYPVTLPPGAMPFPANTWFCPNRPYVDVPIHFPPFFRPGNIKGVTVRLSFHSGIEVLPHDIDIQFNGQKVGELRDTVPNGDYSWNVPAELVNTGSAGPVQQTVSLHTRHMNSGHYVVASDLEVVVMTDGVTVYVCATSQEEAEAKAKELTGWKPLPTGLEVDIRYPQASSTVMAGPDGRINLKAYLTPYGIEEYYNFYTVQARLEYLGADLPAEIVPMYDDGMLAEHGDPNRDDRFFNAMWTPKAGGLVRLTVTAEVPGWLTAEDTLDFTVQALPDFAVTRVWQEEVSILNEVANIRAEITNLGFAYEGPLRVQFRYYQVDEATGEPTGEAFFVSTYDLTYFSNIFDWVFDRGEVIQVVDNRFTAPKLKLYYVVVEVDPG